MKKTILIIICGFITICLAGCNNKIPLKYGIKETNFNELVVGNIDEYDDILKILKNNDILDLFANNNELLLEVLLNSNKTVINNVLDIIEKDLSVDRIVDNAGNQLHAPDGLECVKN